MIRVVHLPWVAVALLGCIQPPPPPPPGTLEIGENQGGRFRTFFDGATAAVVLGANGLNMVVPSLRAVEIDPRAPDPTVTVEVVGRLMAADIEGTRPDMKSDGTGFVLWDLRVPFQVELCCFICRDGRIAAGITDASGRLFEGTVTVRLERGGCPDPPACCKFADACPDPSLTQVCE